MTFERDVVNSALSLHSSRDYYVSSFNSTSLYGGRPTYIYSTAVRHPDNDNRTVGVIMIVFDSEPQFRAMLMDVLPKDDNKQIREGSFGLFVNRQKLVISSTNPEYPAGSTINLEDSLFRLEKGERESTIVEIGSKAYALGLQVSNGYREYKKSDGYSNDIICMIFVPL